MNFSELFQPHSKLKGKDNFPGHFILDPRLDQRNISPGPGKNSIYPVQTSVQKITLVKFLIPPLRQGLPPRFIYHISEGIVEEKNDFTA